MSNLQPALIVHVIHHLHMGGMENTLVNLINELPRASFRHAVICVEDHSDFRLRIKRDDVEVVSLHRSQVGLFAMRKRIYRLCQQWQPAIVHSRNQSGLDALLPAFLARVPIRIHSEHGWDVDNLDGGKWKPALLKRLHRPLVNRYLTVSKDLARFLTRRVGVSPSDITQIYNGVDTDRFRPRVDEDTSSLSANFTGPDVVCIGTVGRAQPVKDQATLIRALAQLLQRRPLLRKRVRLLIVGDGPLLAPLQSLTDDLALSEVALLAGASNQVPELMRAMDLFVLPSLNEGVSNTLLEAMASGLPVLASRVGGNPELVPQGVGGQLFAAGNVDLLSQLLERYVDEPDMRRAHGLQARAWVEQNFSIQSMVASYASFYKQLLSGLN